jgi:hypothetical protein
LIEKSSKKKEASSCTALNQTQEQVQLMISPDKSAPLNTDQVPFKQTLDSLTDVQ